MGRKKDGDGNDDVGYVRFGLTWTRPETKREKGVLTYYRFLERCIEKNMGI